MAELKERIVVFSGTRVYPTDSLRSDGQCTTQQREAYTLSDARRLSPDAVPDGDVTYDKVVSMDPVSVQREVDAENVPTAPTVSRVATPSDVEPHTDVNIVIPNNASETSLQNESTHKHHHLTNGTADYAKSNAPIRRLEHPVDRSLFWSFILSLIFLVTSLICLGPSLVVLCLILPLGWLTRHLVACCCCCAPYRVCSRCCSDMLTNQELLWLHDTKFNKMVSQSMFIVESGLDIARIRDMVNARVVSAEANGGNRIYARFTQNVIPLGSGYAWRLFEDFRIEDHIIPIDDGVESEAELSEYVANMASTGLSRDKPLWEMHVLRDFGVDKDCVILLRVHPCLSDGITLMRLLTRSLVDYSPHNEITSSRFGHSTFVFNAFRAIFTGPIVFLQKWIFTRGDCNLLQGPMLSGQKVIGWSEPFSLAEAMRIKQITRSTLNDVLLSVVAGNVRKCLQTQGVANPYDMLAMLPIDLHSDSHYIKMGVQFVLSDISLPTNTEGTIPRLWEIKHRMDELKNSADPVIMYGCMNVLANLLPMAAWSYIWRCIVDKSSCFIANLQGPGVSMTFASREVKRAMYWMPSRDHVALSLSILTYADQVQLTVMADKAIVPNPAVLTRDFIHELEKLKMLLANRRIPGEHSLRRMELLHDDGGSQPESTIEEIQCKMAEVQEQLQQLKRNADQEESDEFAATEEALAFRVQQLKEEFRQLLLEMRRKKSVDGSILSDDEDEEDGELRRSYRRRTYSGSSRRSVASISAAVLASAARPLHTSVAHCTTHNASSSYVHQSSTPSTPSHVVSEQARHPTRRFHTIHHPPSARAHLGHPCFPPAVIDAHSFSSHPKHLPSSVSNAPMCRSSTTSFPLKHAACHQLVSPDGSAQVSSVRRGKTALSLPALRTASSVDQRDDPDGYPTSPCQADIPLVNIQDSQSTSPPDLPESPSSLAMAPATGRGVCSPEVEHRVTVIS